MLLQGIEGITVKTSRRCAIESFPGNHLINQNDKTEYIQPICQQHMSMEELKRFLVAMRADKTLYDKVSSYATANEIAYVASTMGFKFTETELKSISNQNIEGIKIKMQDTTPSYNFGEGGN